MNFRKNLTFPQVGFQVVPLVDVVFVALIFFMVASVTARWETKMELTVPTASTGVRAPRSTGEIIVNIDAGGRIFIQNVEMDVPRLEGVLLQVAREFQDQPVIIRADAQTRHEKVIAVLDACRKADIWNVAFATLPEAKE